MAPASPWASRREGVRALSDARPTFLDQFVELFGAQFHRLQRFLNRLSGDPDLAQDVAQETFVRLFRRGSLPDSPEAWLITVAMNLMRNAGSSRARRLRLLTPERSERVLGDPPESPDQAAIAEETRRRVRSALDRLTERERSLLLLQAEGYSYRDIASALKLREASIGVLLARARRAFRGAYGGSSDAP